MKYPIKLLSLSLFVIFTMPVASQANVILPSIFGDHMVLQQNSTVTIWGWAKPFEEVKVIASWNNDTVKTVATNRAEWKVELKTPKAGGPYTLKIQGYNHLELKDIMVGEVWFCSGQSNMEWTARNGIDNAKDAIANANYPEIRFFSVPHRTADAPQIDTKGDWKICSPETMIDFSAIAYFFGKRLNDSLNVPIGLINSSWGGTPAEIWVSEETITQDEQLEKAEDLLPDVEWGPHEPGKAFNAMVAPVIPFKIAGALWYQGETNTIAPLNYAQLLPALIHNWRDEWGYEFPFYYVQIAPWKYDIPLQGVLLRDAQRRSLSTPKTGMVVISDIGNIENIHPTNKHDVGYRLATIALAKDYGFGDIVHSGPLYKEMKKEGKKIRLFFDHAENGLMVKGKELTYFQIAGEDQVFYDAKAKIDGNTVLVSSNKVKDPVAVRFAWANTAEPNLFNKAGLPASSFRTDDWKIDSN